MSTKFFNKKKTLFLSFVFSICVVIATFFYSIFLAQAKGVEFGKTFYFLVTEDKKVEVGAEFAKLDGGAGYLLDDGNREYVALSVYLSREEGEDVRKILETTGRTTSIIEKGGKKMYFKGKDKKLSSFYIDALKLLENYLEILNDCIERLEKGMTQEQCKKTLSILEKQYLFNQSQYGDYEKYASVCNKSAEKLREIRENTVYLTDLRYLLCWQAEKYVGLCSAFSL